ncbi:MAG: type I-B CRISPR-associated protein Cas5 [Planctomycetes bacterium RBG_16_43_13]|nr:MAG: type I-B CRISPR-associated protein Cas5 [Planctomycetes bacterium RBG_16_43_13]
MWTIAFEIRGQYGHFRKPYAPASPVTYPFPPPPSIMGMIGAICGYGKDEYAEKIGWNRVRIAVSLLSPVKRYRTALNLVNTKGNKFFRLIGDAPRIQIPYEFLKDPAYRIYVAEAQEEVMDSLKQCLVDDKTAYTPCLGLAQCLASISYYGEFEAVSIDAGEYEVNSVVPLDQIQRVHYTVGERYTRFRIPERMMPDRTVEKYGEVVVEENAGKIRVETSNTFKVGADNVLFF